MSGTLIVGASLAGVQLAMSLREGGDTQPITLVGAEARPPYQRPPLSKAFLLGRADDPSLALRTAALYAERGIDVVTGERVAKLTFAGPTGSGTAVTEDGRELLFDRLGLTVGARVRRLDVPGAELAGLHYLRDVDDAVRVRDGLASASTVVVVGGGFIGLEVAAVARALGRAVTVVEAAERLIPRSVTPAVSEFYRRAHERRGTTVRVGAAVRAFAGAAGRVRGVVLEDGTELPADLVLVGIGIEPRTELAEATGLECDGGIVVDGSARTSREGVVAAGDCTVAPHPLTGGGRVRLESVQNAISQARAAAATLGGRAAPAAEVPWFWSDQFDLKLQIAGLAAGHDEVVVRGDIAAERFSVLYYRDGALLAVDAVNTPSDYLAVRKALASGVALPAGPARSGRPLKELLARPTEPPGSGSLTCLDP